MITFFLRAESKKTGLAPIYVRVKTANLDLKQSTGYFIKPKEWGEKKTSGTYKSNRKAVNNLNSTNKDLLKKLNDIKSSLEVCCKNEGFDGDEMGKVIERVVNAEAIELSKTMEQERIEAEKHISLDEWMNRVIEEEVSGERTRIKDTNRISDGTIRNHKSTMRKVMEFENGKCYDLENVDIKFYRQFSAFLRGQNLQTNAVGKYIKILKHFLSLADKERRYIVCQDYRTEEFRVGKTQADTAYLTQEELQKLYALELRGEEERVRDTFLLGCCIGQRFSDYSRITPHNIINRGGRVVYSATQQKTGTKVEVICSKMAREILAKYNNEMPKVIEQHLNRIIKDLCQRAGIDSLESVTRTYGGETKTEMVEKYKLISSHTARRTAATLLYLECGDLLTIQTLTGHKDLASLKLYLRQEISRQTDRQKKYKFFD